MPEENQKIPDKKSFLLYCDQSELIQKLSDEQAGNLIKQIYSYCGNGRNRPDISDPLTDIVFTALQTSLDRDHLKYLKIVERNRNNGQLGGRPKNNPLGSLGTQRTQANPKNPSEPDSDSDSDSDSVKDKEKDIPDSNESGKFYKSKSGKKLTGKRLDSFLKFWETFNLKNGKAAAADQWLKISPLNDRILSDILNAAGKEYQKRQSILDSGGTPKWAQGWISDRRWEDESYKEDGSGVETDADYAKRMGYA